MPLQAPGAEPLYIVRRTGEHDLAAGYRRRQLHVRSEPRILLGFAQRLRKAAVGHIVRERQHRGSLPDEADECRLGGEVELAGCGRHEDDVAASPGPGNEADVGDEPDAAHHRRGRDRAPVGVVVERDVARDHRHAESVGGPSDAFDRLFELPADRRLLRVAEVEAVGERKRLPSRARDVAGGAQYRKYAGAEWIALARRRSLKGHCEPAQRWAQPQHRAVEPGPPHGARANQLVVLLVDPGLRRAVVRRRLDVLQ